jgi:hypothetical protein
MIGGTRAMGKDDRTGADVVPGIGIDAKEYWRQVEEILGRVAAQGGKTGRVSVSLAWDNINDLDLHVETGDGHVIYYGHKESPCGGVLDVDQNVSSAKLTDRPVENIVWPEGRQPRGPLKIYVGHYQRRDGERCSDPTSFRIVVRDGGPIPRVFTGAVSHDPMDHTKKILVAEVEIR